MIQKIPGLSDCNSLFLFIIICVQLSCVSVRIELEPHSKKSTSFNHYSHYMFFGLTGNDSLNIKQACMEGKPVYIQNYFTFEDFLFAISTIGLYSPKSTRIWCSLPHQASSIKL
ncbi:MAG: hypothetical protein OXH36_03740 [Bdellovibrionales bacterium]|nr:hypothetical protein [Bdellovibrionales bacterium]